MQCNHCGAELQIRREFCPSCGERVQLTMEDIVNVAQTDAAARHGDSLNKGLRTAILSCVALFALVWAIAYVYDKKITFDGASLPSPPANAPTNVAVGVESFIKPLVEPRPLPPITHTVPRRMGYRLEPIKTQLRSANGGNNKDYDIAFDRGLTFLGRGQEADGGWPVKMVPAGWPGDSTKSFQWGRIGVSSLVLLAFLGDGQVWWREGNAPRPKFGNSTQLAIRFLIKQQDPETGRFGPGSGEGVHFMFNHGMATLAMAEAAGISGDPELLDRAQRAVDFIVKAQTDGGGWNYYAVNKVEDMTLSAWQVQALAAAREAGLKVPDEVFKKALDLYRRATINGRVVFRFPNDDGVYTVSLAGQGLMTRQLLGDSGGMPDLKLLSAKILTQAPKVKFPDWTRGWSPTKNKDALARSAFDPYMIYYCTYSLYFSGGSEWTEWSQIAMKSLLQMQDLDGGWHPNDVNAYKGGTYYSTALAILALQVHHRILHSIAQ